jgi:hypothetical protein
MSVDYRDCRIEVGPRLVLSDVDEHRDHEAVDYCERVQLDLS